MYIYSTEKKENKNVAENQVVGEVVISVENSLYLHKSVVVKFNDDFEFEGNKVYVNPLDSRLEFTIADKGLVIDKERHVLRIFSSTLKLERFAGIYPLRKNEDGVFYILSSERKIPRLNIQFHRRPLNHSANFNRAAAERPKLDEIHINDRRHKTREQRVIEMLSEIIVEDSLSGNTESVAKFGEVINILKERKKVASDENYKSTRSFE